MLATKGDISTRNLAWILHANQPGSGLYYDWDYLEIQGKNLKVSASNFSSKPCAELGFPSQRLLDHLNFQFCREWPLTVAQPHPDPRNLGENCSHNFLSPRAFSASQVPGVGRFSLLKPEPSRPPASAAGPSRNRTWLGGRVGSMASSFEGRWILAWQFRKLKTDSKVQTLYSAWQPGIPRVLEKPIWASTVFLKIHVPGILGRCTRKKTCGNIRNSKNVGFLVGLTVNPCMFTYI